MVSEYQEPVVHLGHKEVFEIVLISGFYSGDTTRIATLAAEGVKGYALDIVFAL
jgi:hypothetical protein